MRKKLWAMEGGESGKVSKHKTTESPGEKTKVCSHKEKSDGGINSRTTDSFVNDIIPE